MLADAHLRFEAVRDTFKEASEVVGYDMWDLIQNGEQGALNLTETTQPVLLSCSVALWRAWLAEGGPRPGVMAGHSLGEFSALVCAESLSFADAVSLVRKRGAFMQAAVPVGVGAMAAVIGLDDESINRICADVTSKTEGLAAAVNYNSPGQVVIAGHAGAVDEASALLKEAGAKRVLPLPVSAPFHTQLMQSAGEKLQQALADIPIAPPSVPVIHNVHARVETDPEAIRALLVQQISSPVQWTRCIASITAAGANQLVECGPGKVLSGLNRRIDKTLSSFGIEQPETLAQTLIEIA
ncbi:UNVERIFIED_CONTAM: hypothetical protein GTU68_009671 [Idotea baltica]|nr:hypothetical protein [Idotea baltica]